MNMIKLYVQTDVKESVDVIYSIGLWRKEHTDKHIILLDFISSFSCIFIPEDSFIKPYSQVLCHYRPQGAFCKAMVKSCGHVSAEIT